MLDEISWQKFNGRFNILILTSILGMEDPILFFDELVSVATKNTEIYNKVFKKIHSNIKEDSDLKWLSEFNKPLKPENVELLKEIEGFIVTYPRDFLCNSTKNQQVTKEIDSLFI
jgi:hypothetical protein